MKGRISVFIMFSLIFFLLFYITLSNVPFAEVYNKSVPSDIDYMVREAVVFAGMKEPDSVYKHKEAVLFDFIEKHLSAENGEIFTRINGSGDDRETLAESVGLMLNYFVSKGERASYDMEISFLKNRLMVQKRFVKWRTGEADCNAVIDDLRIVRALLDAYEKWGGKEYYETAGMIQDGINDKLVFENNLYEFYDWKRDAGRKAIPLCYLDLYTLDKLRVFDEDWLKVSDRALETIKNGRTGELSPLFNKYFSYETGRYIKDEESREGRGICLTYSIYTALHLAEANEDTSFFNEWLRKEMGSGRLFAWYNPDTLKPALQMESSAVYALAAVYAQKTGEKDLYYMLLDKMLEFMVADEKSPYFGGFGNPETGEFYSFDNLTALWALSLED